MWSTAREIADGDLVIVWQTRENIQPLLISAGSELQIGSRNGKGFIHVLRPTPELWTMALPHRTQILYLADIAFITSHLNIHRASRVIEAGTGSGSFTHSLARTVGTTGCVWSYEFHEQRANKAREEFTQHGMTDIVILTQRNVCKDGFTVENEADAVFLDLPAPWDAVEHAKKALRKDRPARICCFSPCMEQVLRTVSALNDAGFHEITMYETLSRPTDIHQIPAPLPISILADRLQKSEIRREEKRLRQIAQTKARFEHKRKRDSEEEQITDSKTGPSSLDPQVDVVSKRQKVGEGDATSMDVDQPILSERQPNSEVNEDSPKATIDTAEINQEPPKNVSKIFSEVRGHTSYLTFACLLPIPFPVQTPENTANGSHDVAGDRANAT